MCLPKLDLDLLSPPSLHLYLWSAEPNRRKTADVCTALQANELCQAVGNVLRWVSFREEKGRESKPSIFFAVAAAFQLQSCENSLADLESHSPAGFLMWKTKDSGSHGPCFSLIPLSFQTTLHPFPCEGKKALHSHMEELLRHGSPLCSPQVLR